MANGSSSVDPREIEADKVIDPIILVLATEDKEPLGHRLTIAIEGKEPMTSRAEVPQLTTPMPLRRGTSPKRKV